MPFEKGTRHPSLSLSVTLLLLSFVPAPRADNLLHKLTSENGEILKSFKIRSLYSE